MEKTEMAKLAGASCDALRQTSDKPHPDGELDDLAAEMLLSDWGFLEEEYSPGLFLAGGPAHMVAATLRRKAEGEWSFEFAFRLLVTEEDLGQHEYSVSTGDSRHGYLDNDFVVDAAAIVGPLQADHSPREQILGTLQHMHELLREEFDMAVACHDVPVPEAVAAWIADALPDAEELLKDITACYSVSECRHVRRLWTQLVSATPSSVH